MPISVTCPKCGQTYKLRDELAGKAAKCRCGQAITIPVPSAVLDAIAEVTGPLGVPGDPFAGLSEEMTAAEEASPLKPVRRRRVKQSWSTWVSPKFFGFLLAGAVVCAAIGGLIFLVVRLAEGPPPRWNSPDEVYATWCIAPTQSNWKLFFDTQAPDNQDRLALDMACNAVFGASYIPAFGEVCGNYGFTPADLESLRGNREGYEEAKRTVEEAVDRMSDSTKADLFVDVVEIFVDDQRMPEKIPFRMFSTVDYWRTLKEGRGKARLCNVKIDGNVATADVEHLDDAGKVTSVTLNQMPFVKINDEWRMGSDRSATEGNAGEEANRLKSFDNMKQLGVAMHKFLESHRNFPSRTTVGKQGKPLLSWRVQLLPHLGQEALYQQFHLDEPWDSSHNQALIAQMPAVFRNPGSTAAPGMTTYLAPVGPGTLYQDHQRRGLFDIPDGTTNTVMLVEVNDDRATSWTKPEDWTYDKNDPFAGLGSAHKDGFFALLCDGSARFIKPAEDAGRWPAMLSINGGEQIDW